MIYYQVPIWLRYRLRDLVACNSLVLLVTLWRSCNYTTIIPHCYFDQISSLVSFAPVNFVASPWSRRSLSRGLMACLREDACWFRCKRRTWALVRGSSIGGVRAWGNWKNHKKPRSIHRWALPMGYKMLPVLICVYIYTHAHTHIYK